MAISHGARKRLGHALAALGVVLLLPTVGGRAEAPASRRPSVLVLSVDTLRADRLSAYGYERNTSPNIDALIEAGVKLTQARTVEPLTGPALCSLVTSQHPHQHGASRNGLRMRRDLDSLPRLLRSNGYTTGAFVGNWTLKDKVTGLAAHFDEYQAVLERKRWFGMLRSEATADDVNRSALGWLDQHVASGEDQPFFLWVHYVEPHAPYRLQGQFLERLGIDADGSIPAEDRYDTEVAEADRAAGDLLRRVRELVDEEDLLVIFTSDHGESLGEHNYWGHGRNLYEPTLHVPLSVTWPGTISPSTIDSPALITDIAPTVAGLLNLDSPESFTGQDWTPVLLGKEKPAPGRLTQHQAHRGVVLSKHDSELARRSGLLEVGVIHDGVKEILRVKNGRHWKFDLGPDPQEREDLTAQKAQPSEYLQEWTRVVYFGLGDLDDAPLEPLDEESVERLKALGYAD